jgi:hypothetical protein
MVSYKINLIPLECDHSLKKRRKTDEVETAIKWNCEITLLKTTKTKAQSPNGNRVYEDRRTNTCICCKLGFSPNFTLIVAMVTWIHPSEL